jgi:hypothetical protein
LPKGSPSHTDKNGLHGKEDHAGRFGEDLGGKRKIQGLVDLLSNLDRKADLGEQTEQNAGQAGEKIPGPGIRESAFCGRAYLGFQIVSQAAGSRRRGNLSAKTRRGRL